MRVVEDALPRVVGTESVIGATHASTVAHLRNSPPIATISTALAEHELHGRPAGETRGRDLEIGVEETAPDRDRGLQPADEEIDPTQDCGDVTDPAQEMQISTVTFLAHRVALQLHPSAAIETAPGTVIEIPNVVLGAPRAAHEAQVRHVTNLVMEGARDNAMRLKKSIGTCRIRVNGVI